MPLPFAQQPEFSLPFSGMLLGTTRDHDVLYIKRHCTVFKGESWHE